MDLEIYSIPSGPTENPTASPTHTPQIGTTHPPTESPTRAPTIKPTKSPTRAPTFSPTKSPTLTPTRGHTTNPPNPATTIPPTILTEKPTSKPINNAPNPATTIPPTIPTKTPTHKPIKGSPNAPLPFPSWNPTSYPSVTTSPPAIDEPVTGAPTSSPLAGSPVYLHFPSTSPGLPYIDIAFHYQLLMSAESNIGAQEIKNNKGDVLVQEGLRFASQALVDELFDEMNSARRIDGDSQNVGEIRKHAKQAHKTTKHKMGTRNLGQSQYDTVTFELIEDGNLPQLGK